MFASFLNAAYLVFYVFIRVVLFDNRNSNQIALQKAKHYILSSRMTAMMISRGQTPHLMMMRGKRLGRKILKDSIASCG